MKKTIKTIILIAILITAYSVFRKKPLDKVEFSNNLSDVVTPNVSTISSNFEVDFELCEVDKSYETSNSLGSIKLEVKNKTNTDCVVETTFKTGNSYFTNICYIPLELGKMEFEGISFDQIARYCELPADGDGLLELK